jgi:RNA polymerase sigma factor (sigma-70 family)
MLQSGRERHPETRRTAQTEDRAGPDCPSDVPTPVTGSPPDPATGMRLIEPATTLSLPLTDEQLMERFRTHGDEADFTAVIENNRSWMLALARRILHGSPEAEDLVQDASVKLYENHGYDPNRPLRAWLTVVLKHAAIDFFRKRRPVTGFDFGRVLETTHACDPALIADVRRAIEMLPEEERSVIEQQLEGFTTTEIAAHDKCAGSTVHRRGKAGEEHLRVMLSQYGAPS